MTGPVVGTWLEHNPALDMLNVLSTVLVMFCRVRSVYVLFVNHSYVLSMFRVRFWLCSVGYVLALFRLCSVYHSYICFVFVSADLVLLVPWDSSLF